MAPSNKARLTFDGVLLPAPSTSRRLALDAASLSNLASSKKPILTTPTTAQDSDDDEAPQAESNAKGKAEAQRREEQQRALKKCQSEARAKVSKVRQAAALANKAKQKADLATEKEQEKESSNVEEESKEEQKKNEEASDEEVLPSSSIVTQNTLFNSHSRLDPSLFARAFGPSSAPSSSRTSATSDLLVAREERLALRRAQLRAAKRRGVVVQGRDGLPMRRLSDGRTIVRALAPLTREAEAAAAEASERLVAPSLSSDVVASTGPNAKVRAFLKRRLQGSLKPTFDKPKHKKPKRTDNDPLGLQDPAFLPGGELEHLALPALTGKPKRQRGQPPKAKRGQKRDAASRTAFKSRTGPSLAFAAGEHLD